MLTTFSQLTIGVTDLAAAFLFMYGLKRMSSPVTAPSGIFVAGIGMLAAVLASFLYAFNVNAAAQAVFARQSWAGRGRTCYRRRRCLARAAWRWR